MPFVVPGSNIYNPYQQYEDIAGGVGGILGKLLGRYDETRTRRRQIEDLSTLNQVMQQVQNDPEKASYYINLALPRIRTKEGMSMMANLMAPGEYTTAQAGAGIISKKTGKMVGQVPIPEERIKPNRYVVQPGEAVINEKGEVIYKHPQNSKNPKLYNVAPENSVVDEDGNVVYKAPPKAEVPMTDKDIADKIHQYDKLEASIVSGKVSDTVEILKQVNVLAGNVSPEMQDAAQRQDRDAMLKCIRNEKSYYQQLRYEKLVTKRFPKAQWDQEAGLYYITVKGRKKYITLE